MYRYLVQFTLISLLHLEGVIVVDELYFTDGLRQGLFKMPLTGGDHQRVPILNLFNPTAVAYDYVSEAVYVAERGIDSPSSHKFIASFSYNSGSSKRRDLPRAAIPDGIAFDPISRLLYYSDAADDIIGALTADLKYETVIINEGLEEPRGIVLDPLDGFIFWTDWGSFAHIGRAYMDGSQKSIIVSSGLGWPNGITLDITGKTKQLYWCDAGFDKIERSNLDGSGRTLLYSSNSHIFGLVVDEMNIYFTDWTKSAIQVLSKSNMGQPSFLGTRYPSNTTKLNGIAIRKESLRITGENPCSSYNGGCQHICLVRGPTSKVCRCHPGFILLQDGLTCRQVNLRRGLILTDQDRKGIFALDLDVDEVLRLPILGHAAPRDVAYDRDTDLLFWVDSIHRFVASACIRKSCVNTLAKFSDPYSEPVGIAIDRNRRVIYIVDEGLLQIKSMTYFGTGIKVLIDSSLEKPRSIVLDTTNRFMYWSDWGRSAKIERASMDDGSSRETFVSRDLTWPNGLALDPIGRRLFWTEGKYGRIEAQNLDGTNREVLHSDDGINFLGLTYGDGTLYWSVTKERAIFSLHLPTNTLGTYGKGEFKNVFGMDYFSNASAFLPAEVPGERAGATVGYPGVGTDEPGLIGEPGQTDGNEGSGGGGGGGLDQTVIIALSVSICGVVVVVMIIVVGIICYKKLDAKLKAAHTIPLAAGQQQQPLELQPPKVVATAPKVGGRGEDNEGYSEVIDRDPPPPQHAIRPPAPLPPLPQTPRSATNFQLPPVPATKPRKHPFLGPIPDVVGAGGVPAVLNRGSSNADGYSDRPVAMPDYAGLLRETRQPPPIPHAYTNMTANNRST